MHIDFHLELNFDPDDPLLKRMGELALSVSFSTTLDPYYTRPQPPDSARAAPIPDAASALEVASDANRGRSAAGRPEESARGSEESAGGSEESAGGSEESAGEE